jgi:cyclic beta-1,2-glucan synthetase
VRREDGLILLLAPPFDKGPLDPGYVKGYVPGVRENGGQYTHAALWTVIAYAMLGDGERAAELFGFLNPINHATNRAELHRYKVEPYVIAADVYALPPYTGRGGWTWYTGSASWMYRAGLEFILGFKLRGESLLLEPCVPPAWRDYEITYLHGKTPYHIRVENSDGPDRDVINVNLDGESSTRRDIPLVDDGRPHEVQVILGAQAGIVATPSVRALNKTAI